MTTNLKTYLHRIASAMMLILSVAIFASCSKSDPIEDESPTEEIPNNDNSNLKFTKSEDGTFGFEIKDDNGGNYATQPTPAIIRVKDSNGKEKILKSGYQTIAATTNGFTCSATIATANGSQFTVTDNITIVNNTTFKIKRNVMVDKAMAADKGFSSQFSIMAGATGSTLNRYNLFAPGFLYRDNDNNNPYENNPNLKEGSFDYRETRYGLPMFMAHSEGAKQAISLSHVNPKIKSSIDEKNSKWWTV